MQVGFSGLNLENMFCYHSQFIINFNPDLVIYLQAPVRVLLDRIHKRGRHYERWIDPAYLEGVNEAYARFFHCYNAAPLLVINAEEIDFINNKEDYNKLLNHIMEIKSGHQYFNSPPTLMWVFKQRWAYKKKQDE